MALAVVTVAASGLPVVEVSGGMPVTEAANGLGIAVTKVVGKPGLPVTFVTADGGPVVPPVTYVTLEAATVTAVTLSGGNLTAANTGTTSADQGARVASSAGKTSGKYYFEMTCGVVTAGGNRGVGVGTTASTYTGMGTNGTTGLISYASGTAYSGGSTTGGGVASVWANGKVFGFAINLDLRRGWIRVNPAGIWNNNAANDPVANVGGLVIPAGTMVPLVVFGGTGGTAGNNISFNFGASAFNGAVPSGFTAGWPA